MPLPNEPEPDTVIPPPEFAIVVAPVYEFAPDNVNVPALDLVNVPVPVAIAPEIDVVPMPSIVRFVFVPEIPPDNVSEVAEST